MGCGGVAGWLVPAQDADQVQIWTGSLGWEPTGASAMARGGCGGWIVVRLGCLRRLAGMVTASSVCGGHASSKVSTMRLSRGY